MSRLRVRALSAVLLGGALAGGLLCSTVPVESAWAASAQPESATGTVSPVAPLATQGPSASTADGATEVTVAELQADGLELLGSGFDADAADADAPSLVTLTMSVDGGAAETVAAELDVTADGSVVAVLDAGAFGAVEAGNVLTFTFTQGEGDAMTSASIDVSIVEPGASASPPAPSPIDPAGHTTQPVFAPTDVVTYVLSGFTPDAVVMIELSGPVGGSFPVAIGADGTYTGEITYNKFDPETGADLGRVDFPVGTYALRASEADSGAVAEFTFEVARAERAEPAPTAPSAADELVPTGADGFVEGLGLGLLALGAGGAVLLRGRWRSRRPADGGPSRKM